MNIFVRLKGKTAGNLTWHYDSKLHVFAIKSIFVVKNCRQQGIGNKLMLKALEKAEEFKCLYYFRSR